METNLVPAFVPSEEALTGCFCSTVYNYQGSHIQKLLDTCIGQNGGAGELLNNSLVAWLNEAFPSAVSSYCLASALSLFPVLAFLSAIESSAPSYFKTRLWNIMSALSIGFTEVGVQRLSQGIFNCRSVVNENGGTVTISPLSTYTPVQAMAFLNLSRRIAPPQYLIFVAPSAEVESLTSPNEQSFSSITTESAI